MSMENRQKLQISEDLRKWVRERWVDIGAPQEGVEDSSLVVGPKVRKEKATLNAFPLLKQLE